MRIRYIGPHSEGVDVANDGGFINMPRLKIVDVPDELAARLLEQEDNFERVAAKKKAPAKKAAAKTEKRTTSSDASPEAPQLDAQTDTGQED